jgi:hypothetical protein
MEDSRERERPEGERPIRDAIVRRLIRFGERFDSDELDRGEVELELPEPNPDPPPEEEQVEPWGLAESSGEEKHRRFGHRLRSYKEHIGSQHGD